MPKLTLEFNLPEEKHEFNSAYHGVNFQIALEEILTYMRRRYKHEEPVSEEVVQYHELISNKLVEICRDNGVLEHL